MKQNLRLVADNTGVRQRNADAREHAAIEYPAFMDRARYGLSMMLLVLGAPFHFTGAMLRLFVATGRGFLRGIVSVTLGVIGLGLIVCVGYGLLREVVHPLFH